MTDTNEVSEWLALADPWDLPGREQNLVERVRG